MPQAGRAPHEREADMIGVIPSAGKGTRAYPYTKGIPKGMLEVGGEPNLARVIRIMRDQLQIVDIVLIIGRFGHAIRDYFGDGSRFGVRLTYVENDAVDRGLSYSLLLSKPHVDDHFCVILSDECYVGTNHHELLALPYRDHLATCAVAATSATETICENYAVSVSNGRVTRIVEKPAEAGDALLGMGTWVFSPEIYGHLEAALASPAEGPSDPVSVLGRLCARGVAIAPFHLRGAYVNINRRDHLNLANNLVRSLAFEQRSAALVALAKGSIDVTQRVVDEFRALGRFSRIVVVTPPEGAAPADVEHVRAPSSAYGAMMTAGLDRAASADIMFTVLADGSFSPADVPKFLEYLKDADLVVGTRTSRQLVHQGTNMRGVVRIAHVLLGRLIDAVWWGFEPRFTDVGCAYRALWAASYRLIRPKLVANGPEYFVEMVLETLKCRRRVIEIPVNFRLRRPGMREREQTLRTFVTVAWCIIARRFASIRA